MVSRDSFRVASAMRACSASDCYAGRRDEGSKRIAHFEDNPTRQWTAGTQTWQIPAERMKLRLQHKDDEARDHLVPLFEQAIEAIDALRT
jgi:hypothetical protein